MTSDSFTLQAVNLPHKYSTLRLVIISGISLILAIIVAITVWDHYGKRNTLIQAAEIQTQGYARALKEHAERTFSETDLVLQVTVRQMEAAGGPARLDRAAQQRLLRKNAELLPYIGSIVFIDAAGQMQAVSIQEQTRLPNLTNRPLYHFHRENRDGGLFINPPFKSRVTGKWRFSLSRRVNTPSGEFAGIVMAALDISYFEKLYASLASDRNARYSLATIPGNYLVLVPNAEHVYESSKQTNATFRKRVAHAPTQTYHTTSSNVFGEPRIVSYHRLDRYPVVAIMSFNQNHVLADWRSATLQTAVTSGTFILLVSVLTVLLLKQVKLLDHKVQERTSLLSLANKFLEKEIEERKEVETNLLAHQRKIDQMASELSLAEDRERGRIAGELHDQVGQRLICCKIKLDGLASEAACSESIQAIMEIENLVDQSLQDIRTLTFQLRPPVLASAGLLPALQWLGEELRRDYGLELNFDVCCYGTALQSLRYEIRSTLFQIVRELLLNIVKHAGVSVAWISLQQTEELLLINVIDNGRGFDTSAAPVTIGRQGGFGMYNLQQKLEFLGGSCHVDSSPDMGTFVTLSLPLKPELFEETE